MASMRFKGGNGATTSCDNASKSNDNVLAKHTNACFTYNTRANGGAGPTPSAGAASGAAAEKPSKPSRSQNQNLKSLKINDEFLVKEFELESYENGTERKLKEGRCAAHTEQRNPTSAEGV